MFKSKTEYIICLYLINYIWRAFAASNLGFTLTCINELLTHLLANSSNSSLKKLNLLTLWISISQYSICICSTLLSFPLTFYRFCSFETIHFLLPFSKHCFNLIKKNILIFIYLFFFSFLPKWSIYLHFLVFLCALTSSWEM